MAGALSKIKKVGQAAEKAAEKTKGLGERAAEAALKKEQTARDRAMIEAAKAAKQGFLEPSVEKDVLYHGTRSDISKFIPGKRGAVFLTRDIDFANDYAPTSQMLFLNELPNSPNVMPVYAQVRNPFDYENPEHIDMVLNRANLPKAVDPQKIRDNLELGNWNYIEDKNIQKAIKDLGFDAFYIKEQGLKNIGVFDPKKIKSAIGMQGSYDITDPDITKAEGGAVTPDVVGGGTGIPLKKGGKVDHKLKEWFAAQGGFTDSYEQGLESQEKKSSDIEAYKQGKVGADALLRYFPGLSAAMVEEQLNPQMAKGGEVKMQGGGDPTAQIQQQLSQGVPVQMVPGKYGDIARQLIQIEEAARKKQEEERKARVSSLPLKDKALGAYEAGRTIQSVLGQEILKPIVALTGGEGKVKELEEKTVLPETEAGAQYLSNTAEFLAPMGKFLEATKMRDVPFGPETGLLYLPGLGTQLTNLAGKAVKKIDQAIPESLKNLPVGASIELVDEAPGKKKAPADRTGLYSPMEKAALNLERKEGTGMAFLNDLKKAGVTDEELEFSNVKRHLMDNADRKIPRDTVAAWASQSRQPFNIHNIKEGQSIDDFNFTGREVIDDDEYIISRASDLKSDFDYLYPETRERLSKTLLEDSYRGENLNDPLIKRRFEEDLDEMIEGFVREEATSEYYENPYWRVTNNFGYEITGNEDIGFSITRPDGSYIPQRREIYNLEQAESMAREDAIDQGIIKPQGVVYGKYQLGNGTNYQEFIIDAPQGGNRIKYESPHWDSEEYEDVLLHTRTQDRTTTDGKPMLYVDEMQSDWHQEGRDKGYFDKDIKAKADELDKLRRQKSDEAAEISNKAHKLKKEKYEEVAQQLLAETPTWTRGSYFDQEVNKRLDKLPEIQEAKQKVDQLLNEAGDLSRERSKYFSRVPDAPFKDKWHEIGVKQMLHYAAKNGYDRVGFSSANPHIERWGTDQFAWERAPKLENNLSNYEKWLEKRFGDRGDPVPSEGFVKATYGYDGDPVYKEFVKDTQKPAGWRIASTEQRGGRAGDVDLEGEARARGILQKVDGERVSSKEELANVVESTIRNANPAKVERLTNKIWKMMQTQEAGVYEPRAEGMKFFYDQELRKFLEKYAKKIGATFYETETKTGRVVTPEGPKDKTEKVYMIEFTPEAKRSAELGQPFKKGGLVKVDQELREWGRKMAAGGVSKLAKAAGKAAEKAKRMSKAEAEAAGYWHPISETRLAKPIGEYKPKVVEDPKAKMIPKKSVSIEELQGGVAIPLAGDRAAAGRIIQEIEGTPMNVALEGGPDFMRLHPGAAWASGQGVLTMLAKRIKEARESGSPVYGVYTAMSPLAVDFNTMMTESLLNQLDIRDFKKSDIKAFNEAVKSVKGQGGKPKAPNFPGLDDPEIREKLMTGPGGQRDAFVKAMAKAEFQKKGFPDVAAARLAVTEPELLDAPRGAAGYTVARLDPEAKIMEQSGHTTYPLDLAGEYAGGFETQLPVDVMYPTHFEAKRLLGKKPEGAHKSLELFAPLQYLDQQWLDNAMKYLEMQKKLTGRKKGGLAHVRK